MENAFAQSQAQRQLRLQHGLVFVVAALALLLSGCSQPEPLVTRPDCSPDGEDLEVLTCRIKQASYDGRFSRKLSDAEVSDLVGAVRGLGDLHGATKRGELTPEAASAQAEAFHNECRRIVSMDCGALLLMPYDNAQGGM